LTNQNTPRLVDVKFGGSTKSFPVNPEPISHILVENSKKRIHGWWLPHSFGQVSILTVDEKLRSKED